MKVKIITMNKETKHLRKVVNSILVERMTKWSNDPWIVNVKNITVTAPEEEGGLFQLKNGNLVVTSERDKSFLDQALNMGVPDPVRDEMIRKNKENKAKPNPWLDKDGNMSNSKESEYTDEWGRTMTPAKRFKEMEIGMEQDPIKRKELIRKRKEDEEAWLKQNHDEPTKVYEELRLIIRNILKEEFDPEGPMRRLARGEDQVHTIAPEVMMDIMPIKFKALDLLNTSPSITFEELFRAIEESEGSIGRSPADPVYAQIELAWNEFNR